MEDNADISVQIDAHDSSKVIPLSVAEVMIQLWRRNEPEHAGSYLAEAFMGVRPKARRERP